MMQEIQKHQLQTKFIFISCHHEFNFVRSALNMNAYGYVLKPLIADDLHAMVTKTARTIHQEKQKIREEELLEKQLKESLPLLRNTFLRNLIQGIYHDEESVWENIHFLSLFFKPQMLYNILFLEIDDYKDITKDYSAKQKSLLLLNITNIVQEILDKKQLGYAVFY